MNDKHSHSVRRSEMCRWTDDAAEGLFETECGRLFINDKGIKENGFKYCIYCGLQLDFQRYHDK